MTYVLDSSVFVHRVEAEGVAPPSLLNEASGEATRLFLETHRPEVRSPGGRYVDEARSAADETGDLPVLSETDLDVLGLALELEDEGEEPVILTDDYAIQNVASWLGVEFESVDKRGIDEVLEWEWFCTGCGRTYGCDVGECEVCGSGVKRRASGSPSD